MRILSLLPSATEMVCAVGAEAELVGISHECDYPVSIKDRAVLTSARIHTGTSAEIDRAVRDVVEDALSIYTVDEKKLAALSPDVIVTQDLCEVCAVSLDDVRAAVARLAHREQVEIVSLSPMRLGDVWNDIATVGKALGRAAAGEQVRASCIERVQAIAARASRLSTRPRVLSVEWLDPIMLGGTWMPELIALAGGEPVGAKAGDYAPTVTREELAALAPDVVLVKPCGFDVARTQKEQALVDQIAALAPRARVYVSDGNAFFNRPGPRLVESLEIMAACVYPEAFPDLRDRHAAFIVEVST